MPTLEQIQAKLKKLQAQADVLIARKAQAAVDQIRELMLKHGLTTADIEAKAKASRVARGLHGHAGNGKAKAAAGKSVAKYRDHKTGATWTGHGRAPGWIAGVKDRTQFLIEGASELKSAAKSAVAHVKGGKGQPKGAQPPKYLNPKTGATWSGRGPAPTWLAAVKDRSKFLIDAAAAAGGAGHQAATKVAKKAGKVAATKPAAAKKAVAKKATVATRKVAAKKGAAKPAATKRASAKAGRKAPARKLAAKTQTLAASATATPASAGE